MDVSHIMLEAYKKFILVSLILHGKVGLSIVHEILINEYINYSNSLADQSCVTLVAML